MVLTKRKGAKKTEKEKIDERREEVLAAGRKFKYPLQWTHHNIVIRAVLIALIVIILLVAMCWLMLYQLGKTDSLLYNVTRVIPLEVATVDGAPVRFSDYLMLYRGSITSAEKNSKAQIGDDTTALENKYKRVALTDAEKYVYAKKLADEHGITVSDEEIEKEFERQLSIGGVDKSEEAFIKIIEDNFGLSKQEYERMLEMSLLQAKVAEATDGQANATADEVEKLLAENGGDYAKVAEALGDKIEFESTGGLVDSTNIDGGRAAMAMQMEPGADSGKFVSVNGDGFYFVKLLEKTDTKVNFVSIKVPFAEMEEEFQALVDGGKVVEKIEIEGESW